MNKYTAKALAESARDGRRILIITENMHEAKHTLQLLEEHPDGVHSFRRTNGQARVDYQSGGLIDIRSYGSRGHRGISVDTVFLDAGVDQALSMDEQASLMACTAASPTGEYMRA